MEKWENLIPLLEKYEAGADFIAECVYAYIVNYGMECPEDSELLKELVQFIKGCEV